MNLHSRTACTYYMHIVQLGVCVYVQLHDPTHPVNIAGKRAEWVQDDEVTPCEGVDEA